ncbi:MAG: putative phage abortive infection protein [Prevotella sp.]|nr:putative phage abortive infection protein [Prevotella sp.]
MEVVDHNKVSDFPQLIETSEKTRKRLKYYSRVDKWYIGIILSIIVMSVVLFLYKRPLWEFDSTIDSELFGFLGDFVGGVEGTVLALYGTVMLIRSLKNQVESNDRTQTTNDKILQATKISNDILSKQEKEQSLQLFDCQYNTFWNQYRNAIDNCHFSDKENVFTGVEALNKLTQKFLDSSDTNEKTAYGRRVEAARKLFEKLYAETREEMSTHLRMLYQLMHFVSTADYISDRMKVNYAKAVRGSLSESEMIIIRYNCLCPFGKRMQQYINEFNLLKHIPIMGLIEYKKYIKLTPKLENKHVTALNVMFVTLRKNMCDILATNAEIVQTRTSQFGKGWKIVLVYRNTNNTLYVKIQKFQNLSHCNTYAPRSNIEDALEIIGVDNIEGLFYDYFRELFFISNFNIYNRKDKTKIISRKRDIKNMTEVRYLFKSEYPLILTQRQIQSPQKLKTTIV